MSVRKIISALVSLALAAALLADAREKMSRQRAAAATHGGSPRYISDAWGTDEGLPQTSVNAIVQTRDGYLWLATYGGLVRFDGVRFQVFDAGNTPGIKSDRITCLFEDRDGALWIGTDGGGLTRRQDGRFTAYLEADGLPSDGVGAVSQNERGDLWIASGEGAIRFSGGRFTTYGVAEGLPDKVVSEIAQDQRGDSWFGTRKGLARMRDGAWVAFYTTADGLQGDDVRAIRVRRDGSLWVGTSKGLARFDGERFVPQALGFGSSVDEIRCLTEDRAGALWVGTMRHGAFRLDPGGAVTRLTAGDGINDSHVRAVAEDAEGNVWLGTHTGGLNRLKQGRVTSITRRDGLPGDGVVPIVEDRAGDLWIGATCGGLLRLREGKFTRFTERDGLPNECVWSLYADRAGALWIGTWNGGLTRFDGERFTTYTSKNSRLSGDVVLAIREDRRGALWVGTGVGLNRFVDGEFTVFREAEGLVDEDVRFITETSDGALWIGTTGGMSRLVDGRFTNYTAAQGLSHNFVRAIHEDRDGVLWIGTYGGGLNRFRDGRFTPYGAGAGLPDNTVSRILEDAQGYLWMSGNRGITRASRDELNDFAAGRRGRVTSVLYGVADGMANRETNGGGQPAGWRTQDGRLWFPTVEGLAVIDPARIAPNALPPPVAIENAVFDRIPVEQPRAVELQPGRGDLEIRYTALSFTAPEKVQFRYRLEGYDERWVEAGARRVAYYTNVAPGEYTFRVIASNNDGVWNTQGAALRITLRPPFWRTWWFLIFTVAAVVGLAVLGHRRRVGRLKRAHAWQEAFSRRLIESQEVERKRIAAELHDSLGQNLLVIKNRALLGLNAAADRDRVIEQLDEISATASQSIDEVRAIAHDLRPYQLDRLGLTKALESLLRKASESSGIDFSYEIDGIDDLFSKEAEINLYRVVQESINNIVKHSGATEASLNVARDARGVVITIRDDGRGFDPETTDGAGERGFGLTGISERARILGGKQTIRSAPGRGTTVVLKIGLREGGHDG